MMQVGYRYYVNDSPELIMIWLHSCIFSYVQQLAGSICSKRSPLTNAITSSHFESYLSLYSEIYRQILRFTLNNPIELWYFCQ